MFSINSYLRTLQCIYEIFLFFLLLALGSHLALLRLTSVSALGHLPLLVARGTYVVMLEVNSGRLHARKGSY